MVREYKSVSDMVKRLSDDSAFAKKFEQESADRQLAKTLFAMRCANGMSQKDMATKLGCTQSRISKLENSGIDSIKVSDLVAYAKALGLNLAISFHENMSAVDSVKLHAFQIKKRLDDLAELAHRDDTIFDGVKEFYKEYLANMLRLFEESAEKLPTARAKKSQILEVNPPVDIDAYEDLALEV